MALTFDTRKAFQKLLQRGLPEPAADGIVEVVDEATSTVVTAGMLQAQFAAFRSEVRADFAELRADFAEMRTEIYRVALIQAGVVIGAVVALVKLL